MLAGIGVLTPVLMLTRERIHDLGIFKAVGMTPRQTVTMVMCWVVAPAVAAAAIAIPAAIYLHALTVEAIGTITGTGVPRDAITLYHRTGLLVFAASGLAIAAAGALLPASWTAASEPPLPSTPNSGNSGAGPCYSWAGAAAAASSAGSCPATGRKAVNTAPPSG